MTFLFPSLFILLAVSSWFINSRDNKIQTKLIQLLLPICILASFFYSFENLASQMCFYFIGFLIVNWAFSWTKFAAQPLFSHVLLLLTVCTGLLFTEAEFKSGEYTIALQSLPLLALFFVAASFTWVIQKLTRVIGKYFKTGYKNERGFARGLTFFGLAFLALVGHFIAAEIGVLVIYLGLVGSLFYLDKNETEWNSTMVVLSILVLPIWIKLGNIDAVQFDLGRSFAGLFIGLSIGYLAFVLGKAREKKILANAIVLSISFGTPIALILAATQNVNFGGTEAFALFLVGYGISASSGINVKRNTSYIAAYIAIGLLFIPCTINEAEQAASLQITSTKETKQSSKDIFDAETIPFELAGNYSFDSKSSKFVFELGPQGGRTKGAMTQFKGDFLVKENFSSGTIQVVFEMKDLTTFNSYRDESLGEKAYFNVSSFPQATYTSSSMTLNGDELIVEGTLELLGKKQNVGLKMRRLAQDGKIVVIGKSQFDRTKFGMTPDAKEGNVVDCQFQLELLQK